MKIIFNLARLTAIIGLSYTIYITVYVLGTVRVQAFEVSPQPAKFKDQFFDLVIKGKFAISDAASSCKISCI